MAKRKAQKATAKSEEREKREAEARGESDMVQLTNDSGHVKKLTPEDYEAQKETLLREGWRELGQEA